MTIVSIGQELTDYEEKLYKEGKFKEYYLAHGLGVELTEALAEILHKHIRIELGILKNETADLSEVNMKSYQGQRYFFWLPSLSRFKSNETTI